MNEIIQHIKKIFNFITTTLSKKKFWALISSIIVIIGSIFTLFQTPIIYAWQKRWFNKNVFIEVDGNRGSYINAAKEGRTQFLIGTRSKNKIIISALSIKFNPDKVDLSSTEGVSIRDTGDLLSKEVVFPIPKNEEFQKGHCRQYPIVFKAKDLEFTIELIANARIEKIDEIPLRFYMSFPEEISINKKIKFQVVNNLPNGVSVEWEHSLRPFLPPFFLQEDCILVRYSKAEKNRF